MNRGAQKPCIWLALPSCCLYRKSLEWGNALKTQVLMKPRFCRQVAYCSEVTGNLCCPVPNPTQQPEALLAALQLQSKQPTMLRAVLPQSTCSLCRAHLQAICRQSEQTSAVDDADHRDDTWVPQRWLWALLHRAPGSGDAATWLLAGSEGLTSACKTSHRCSSVLSGALPLLPVSSWPRAGHPESQGQETSGSEQLSLPFFKDHSNSTLTSSSGLWMSGTPENPGWENKQTNKQTHKNSLEFKSQWRDLQIREGKTWGDEPTMPYHYPGLPDAKLAAAERRAHSVISLQTTLNLECFFFLFFFQIYCFSDFITN